jgi:hypothetical protein
MIGDSNLVFWSDQSMSGWAIGDHDSGVVAMPPKPPDRVGARVISDVNLKIYIAIAEAVAPATASLLFAVLGSENGTSNWRVLRSSRSRLAAFYSQGYLVEMSAMPLQPWGFLRLRCTVATAALTGGRVNACLVVNPQTERQGAVKP